MAADVVLGFVHRHHRWLEITPESDEYRMEDLRWVFGPGLSKTTNAVAARALVTSPATQVVDLDAMASQLTHVSTADPENRGLPRTYIVSSKTVPIRPSFAALALLSTMRVQTVRRIFRVRDLEYQPPPNNFIWSCYSRAREIDNATAVLTHVIREYEVFIRGNTFHFENSPYLDPATVSIVFEYVLSHDDPQGPRPARMAFARSTQGIGKDIGSSGRRQQTTRVAECGDQQFALRSHTESVTVC